jgi:hypothetical protein
LVNSVARGYANDVSYLYRREARITNYKTPRLNANKKLGDTHFTPYKNLNT